jgi:hypothetical protein
VTLHSIEGTPEGRWRGFLPIVYGLVIIALGFAACYFLPAKYAAVVLGVLAAIIVCYVVIMAAPRGIQIAVMGTALGIGADAGYAQLNNKTPVTVANAVIDLAKSFIQATNLISDNAGIGASEVSPLFVWSFIGAAILFMLLSFLIKHDG